MTKNYTPPMLICENLRVIGHTLYKMRSTEISYTPTLILFDIIFYDLNEIQILKNKYNFNHGF